MEGLADVRRQRLKELLARLAQPATSRTRAQVFFSNLRLVSFLGSGVSPKLDSCLCSDFLWVSAQPPKPGDRSKLLHGSWPSTGFVAWSQRSNAAFTAAGDSKCGQCPPQMCGALVPWLRCTSRETLSPKTVKTQAPGKRNNSWAPRLWLILKGNASLQKQNTGVGGRKSWTSFRGSCLCGNPHPETDWRQLFFG